MRRDQLASTLIQRHFNVVCPLGKSNVGLEVVVVVVIAAAEQEADEDREMKIIMMTKRKP